MQADIFGNLRANLACQITILFQKLPDMCSDDANATLFNETLDDYLRQLERKSLEPVALHFLGESSVRPLQQFFTRSLLKEQALLERYQELFSGQLNASGEMLSVDDSGFVKKRLAFRWGQTPVLRLVGKT